MGHIEVAHVSHALPDGRVLLDDVSFRVGDGMIAALVGPNGAGKTTLIRLAAGDLAPQSGSVTSSGGLGIMRQFVGGIRDSLGGAGGSSPGMALSPCATCCCRYRRSGCARPPPGWTPPSWR